MGLIDYLQLPFFQHALIATTLIAITSGLIGPFVITRGAAFAVHGVAELSFTGGLAGLLLADNSVLGAIVGSLVVASAIGILGRRDRERDSAIGVTLAFGLGIGVYLVREVPGGTRKAQDLLFGQVLGISPNQLLLLLAIAVAVLLATLALYRPLMFASIDPDVAEARGVRSRAVGLAFLFVLALTVTEAAQIVGTLLVLSLAITPAAAALRVSARPAVVTGLSIAFALIASDGGLLVSAVHQDIAPSVFITTFSFAIYVIARVVGGRMSGKRGPVAALPEQAQPVSG